MISSSSHPTNSRLALLVVAGMFALLNADITTVNAAGLAHVTYRPVLSAEDTDKALAKSVEVRPPQQQ